MAAAVPDVGRAGGLYAFDVHRLVKSCRERREAVNHQPPAAGEQLESRKWEMWVQFSLFLCGVKCALRCSSGSTLAARLCSECPPAPGEAARGQSTGGRASTGWSRGRQVSHNLQGLFLL